MHWLWSLLRGASQGQPLPVPFLGLHCNFPMVATCAGLAGAWERPLCKPRPTAASDGHGSLSKKCYLFEWFSESLQLEPRHLYGKTTGKGLGESAS